MQINDKLPDDAAEDVQKLRNSARKASDIREVENMHIDIRSAVQAMLQPEQQNDAAPETRLASYAMRRFAIACVHATSA